jgi:AcrR family transcriptional regulator
MTAGIRRRAGRLQPERRRAAILDAARTLICDRGYENIGMGDIAEHLGVVEGTIYRYFNNKSEVLLGVISEWYQQALNDYDIGLNALDSSRSQLRYLVWGHLELIHRDPYLAQLVFVNIRSRPDYRQTVVYQLNRAYVDRTRAILETAIDRGELRGGVPFPIIRDMLFGAVEHHAFAYLRGEGDFCPASVAGAIVDIVYDGLRPQLQTAPTEDIFKRFSAVADRLEASLANR